MADGPAIQAASLRALAAGARMTTTLELVRRVRAEDAEVPIVLMGYYNPIHGYGNERFLADAKAAGADGLIVVDLPPEEDAELCLPAREAGLDFIRLATPTTDDKRLPAVLENISGFIYYVSVTGITGQKAAVAERVAPGGRAHQAAHPPAGGGGLRHPRAGAGGRDRAHRRRGGGRLGPDRSPGQEPRRAGPGRPRPWCRPCTPRCGHWPRPSGVRAR